MIEEFPVVKPEDYDRYLSYVDAMVAIVNGTAEFQPADEREFFDEVENAIWLMRRYHIGASI